MSVAGVRGAITLAGVLTLPLAVSDGTPFPARDLAIFLAAGVIILSLTASSLLLPRLLRGREAPPEPADALETEHARAATANAAIPAIEPTSALASSCATSTFRKNASAERDEAPSAQLYNYHTLITIAV
jgi:hypothetical protein